MSIPICILTPAGCRPAPWSAESLAEAAGKEPDGIYTLARTFRRDHALLLNEHLDRLEQSAQMTGILAHIDRPALRAALRSLIHSVDYPDSRFRITIPHELPDQTILSLEPFKPVPPEVLASGARCVTVHKERANPAAKTTAWMTERKATVESFPPGVYEGILLGIGDTLLEGTSSNFYAILDRVLRTAGEGVLPGMAQRIVLAVAADVLPIERTPVTRGDLPFLDEAFISSAGRGVVPVTIIDGQVIGSGLPGPQTQALQTRYNTYAEAHLEPI